MLTLYINTYYVQEVIFLKKNMHFKHLCKIKHLHSAIFQNNHPLCLNFIRRRLYIKFRRQGIIQKKAHNIQNKAKVSYQDHNHSAFVKAFVLPGYEFLCVPTSQNSAAGTLNHVVTPFIASSPTSKFWQATC